jgi:hypothetical protein
MGAKTMSLDTTIQEQYEATTAKKRAWDALPPVVRLREILAGINMESGGISVDIVLLRDILAVLERHAVGDLTIKFWR